MCQTATPGDERARPAARAIKVNLKAYDWIVVNSSAGKDSQAMLDVVVERARADGVLDRVVVVHCDLGRVEWPGTPELAERQARHYGVRFEKISRPQGDLLIQVEQRAATIARKGKAASPFPSPTNRYCTAHQKTDQANKVINKLVREKAASPWPSSTNRWCTSDQKRGQVSVVINRLAKERRKKGSAGPGAQLPWHEGGRVARQVEAAPVQAGQAADQRPQGGPHLAAAVRLDR
jgi:hypothetical protein